MAIDNHPTAPNVVQSSISLPDTAPTISGLIDAAFAGPRDPRSPEYKAGMRAVLENRLHGRPIHCPFTLGTAAADAFFAGFAEGRAIATTTTAE
jgi:hypothetical protein